MPAGVLYNLQTNVALPPGDGPQLKAFKHRHKRVEFVRLLSPIPEKEHPSAGHSHVFEVNISKSKFALKIVSNPWNETNLVLLTDLEFKFYQLKEERLWMNPSWSSRASDEELTYQSDPFFAECRAYGRIKEWQDKHSARPRHHAKGGRRRAELAHDREIAVPCYGYLALPADKYEDILCKRFGVTNWNRSTEDEQRQQGQREPYRALVKRLVQSETTATNPVKMLKDLKTLRSIGIYQRDVYARNYKDGLLVDFSIAWTEPHWLLKLIKGGQLQTRKNSELHLFDKMIKAEGFKTTARATRNKEYCKKLRSQALSDDDDDEDG